MTLFIKLIITWKITEILNMLQLQLALLSPIDRMAIFRSLSFFSVSWHFCGKTSIRRVEKIQKRAVRFVNGDYEHIMISYTRPNSLPTLKLGRERSIAILTYKILRDQAPSYLMKDLINCNKNSKFHLPSYKSTKHGIYSFLYRASRIWNSLSETTSNAPFFPSFKTHIKGWTGLLENMCDCCSGEQ